MVEDLITLYEAGNSCTDISKILNGTMTKRQVWKALKEAGIQFRGTRGGTVLKGLEDEAQYLYAIGWSTRRIAKYIGNVTDNTVAYVLKQRGMKLRSSACKGIKCVDCGVPTKLAKRCPKHIRIRAAEISRLAYHERKKR